MEIDLPGEKKRIFANGQVVWVKEVGAPGTGGRRQFNAGVRFVKISPEDKNNLVDFIKASLKFGEQKN